MDSSLAAHFNWQLQQHDGKNAFFHEDLEEENYKKILPIFKGKGTASKVYRLRKALYGLKKSPKDWFGRFSKVMKDIGYTQSQGDHTHFIKNSNSGGVTTLLVYVGDIIVIGNDEKENEALKQCLIKEFEIKSLGGWNISLELKLHTQDRESLFHNRNMK